VKSRFFAGRSDKVAVKQRIYFSPGTPLNDSLNGVIPAQKISPRSPRVPESTEYVETMPVRRKYTYRKFGVKVSFF
jgi:hypothetical protein